MKGQQVLADIGPIPQHAPLLRIHEAAERPQQSGFTRAIRPGDLQDLAAPQIEPNPPQHMALAAPQMEVFAL
jgi:hypothetical protein